MPRKNIILSSVGTSYSEAVLTGLPDSLRIRRVKVDLISGTATEFAAKVECRPTTSLVEDVVLEYTLVPILDYLEDFIVFPYKVKDTDFGQLFIGVKANSSGNKLRFTLEYSK